MKNRLLLILIPLLFGCTDIFEDDLEGVNLIVTLPSENYESSSNSVTFNFNELEDAIDYHLVIVTPDYETIESFVVDSLILSSPFVINLNAGEYEWELYAQNNSSESNRIRRKLFVQEASSLDGLQITLNSPVNEFITSEEEIVFDWDTISGELNYNLQFYQNNAGEIGEAVGNLYSTTEDSISINAPEGNLIWRMNASDWNSQSQFSERFIIVDRTAPEAPEILSPLTGIFLSTESQTFSWNFGEDNLTNTFDSLLVFIDDLTEEVYGVESTNSSEVIDFSSFDVGTYQWTIKTYDEAGNFSQSNYGTFDIE